ncbi:MAG TPA: rhomboid family intramembrane serine protease [Ktedonobacterales bacterium]|nr:rhomboid family intramembrane serine protease [Ktedonobacterales bacterium]
MAFIPLSDNPGPRRRFPFVNYALILINIAVFIYELTLPDQGDCFTKAYSLLPNAVLNGQAVMAQGCSIGEPTPVYLTLITAMFLHAGLLHIGGNMLYLWIFGDNVEDRLGHVWYLVFYLACGLAANGAQIAATVLTHGDLNVLNLGASGAIAGVLGAYLVFYPGSRVNTLIFIGVFFTIARISAFIVIGFWFLLQLVDAFISIGPSSGSAGGGVAYFAHVGGFALGLLIALLVRAVSSGRPNYAATYPAYPVHPDLRGR